MAEPISLTFSVLSLAGLFCNAVDCFNYIQLGKSFESDLRTSLIELDLSRLELARWGNSIGLTQSNDHPLNEFNLSCSKEEEELARTTLQHIIDRFRTAESIAAKPSDDKHVLDLDTISDRKLADLHNKFRLLSLDKLTKVKLSDKTKWVLYKREQLRELVDDINSLVGKLTNAFPATEQARRDLAREHATELAEVVGDMMKTVEDAAAKHDKALKEAFEQIKAGTGAITSNIYANDNAGLVQGINQAPFTFNAGPVKKE